ncbi:MAG: hypothetical protein EOO27_37505 [Comamonadaceae bacterium]|nr:MAG: hypothetical protein EOO27_37505 [Comamonadaceae bacterium]
MGRPFGFAQAVRLMSAALELLALLDEVSDLPGDGAIADAALSHEVARPVPMARMCVESISVVYRQSITAVQPITA